MCVQIAWKIRPHRDGAVRRIRRNPRPREQKTLFQVVVPSQLHTGPPAVKPPRPSLVGRPCVVTPRMRAQLVAAVGFDGLVGSSSRGREIRLQNAPLHPGFLGGNSPHVDVSTDIFVFGKTLQSGRHLEAVPRTALLGGVREKRACFPAQPLLRRSICICIRTTSRRHRGSFVVRQKQFEIVVPAV